MNDAIRPTSTVRSVLVAALALVALLLLMQPASGEAHGKAKFGADLSQPGIDAVDDPQPCPLLGSCTRVQSYYDGPPHAGMTPSSPFDGTITEVRLIAEDAGKLKLQLVKRGMGTESKVRRDGPTLRFAGTGSVETFKVKVPVRQGEWIGFRSKEASTLNCDPTTAGEEHIYQPALPPGGPFTAAYATDQCTALIGATVKAS